MPGKPQGWEPLWATLDTLSDYWRTPERTVVAWAERLWEGGGRRVLDLGCGIGRHTVALACRGFTVTATDVSPSGLTICTAWLARESLRAYLVCQEMEKLPFPDHAFDGLLSYNVVYHTTMAGMRRVLAEVWRVLRPGGWFYITFIARDDSKVAGYRPDIEAGKCFEIEPFTFIYSHDAPGDKFIPHHYCDETEVRDLLADFIVDDWRLARVEFVDDDGALQTGAHYHVRARRV